jgi:hypothetical protein
MKVNELFEETLSESKQEIYDALLPLLLIEEDGGGGGDMGGGDSGSPADGGTPPEVSPSTPPIQPPPGNGWYRPGPFRPGGMGMNGNHYMNQLYITLKNLVVSQNILKRFKELGIKGDGKKRIQMAAKVAAKHVSLMLSNPGATAYRIPVWTYETPRKVKIKKFNEEFSREFKKALNNLNDI